MLNLIKKDLILQKTFLPAYLLFLVTYLWAGMDVAYVIIICSAVFVINTYQSDDKDNANILVNSLPYTRKEIISSKYVGTLLFYNSNHPILFSWKIFHFRQHGISNFP